MVLNYSMLAAALVLAPLAAQAQPAGGSDATYRCVGADGKKYYGSIVPAQCAGRVIELMSNQGIVIRRIDPEGDEKMRLAKEVAAAKKREDDAIAKEASRRNRALLATYTSEKDIDDARGRALADNEKALQEIEQRIAEIKKRQAAFDKEMEFYKDGAAKPSAEKKAKPAAPAKAEAKVPPKLLQDMNNAEVELSAQENLLTLKRKELDGINAKYDEDKRRFLELTGQDASGRGKALGVEGVTVTTKPDAKLEDLRNKRSAEERARMDRLELERLERERAGPRTRQVR
jgi:hypothetical protein